MADEHVLLGDPVDAFGHPDQCSEPAPGTVQADPDPVPIRINGTHLATRATTVCHFDPHAHSIINGVCADDQSHDVTTDQQHPITVNGSSIVLDEDTTTDPGSDGTVSFPASAGTTVVELIE